LPHALYGVVLEGKQPPAQLLPPLLPGDEVHVDRQRLVLSRVLARAARHGIE